MERGVVIRMPCRLALVLAPLLALSTGCMMDEAAQRDVSKISQDMNSLARTNEAARELVDRRLGRLETELRGRVESSLKQTEESRVALQLHLQDLLTEIQHLEGRLDENTGTLARLQRQLDGVQTQVQAASRQEDAKSIQGKLDENALALAGLQRRLEGLETQAKGAGQRMTVLDERVQAAEQSAKASAAQSRALQEQQARAAREAQPGPAEKARATPEPPAAVAQRGPAGGSQELQDSIPMAEARPTPPPGHSGPVSPVRRSTPAPPAAPPAVVASRTAPEKNRSAEEIYKLAMADYTRGNFDSAVVEFRTYLRQEPATSLAASAQYWLAESYFGLKNYTLAVEEFRTFLHSYPDTPDAAKALFRQGAALLQLGDSTRAATVMCELIATHPKTREAALARDTKVECPREAGLQASP